MLSHFSHYNELIFLTDGFIFIFMNWCRRYRFGIIFEEILSSCTSLSKLRVVADFTIFFRGTVILKAANSHLESHMRTHFYFYGTRFLLVL